MKQTQGSFQNYWYESDLLSSSLQTLSNLDRKILNLTLLKIVIKIVFVDIQLKWFFSWLEKFYGLNTFMTWNLSWRENLPKKPKKKIAARTFKHYIYVKHNHHSMRFETDDDSCPCMWYQLDPQNPSSFFTIGLFISSTGNSGEHCWDSRQI